MAANFYNQRDCLMLATHLIYIVRKESNQTIAELKN
jgi:hypothetical protein